MYHGLHRFAWGRWVGLVGAFLLGSGSVPAWAGTFSWTGGDGTSQLWSTGSNWSGGTAPTSASDTVINFDVMNNPGTSTNRLQQDIANPFLLNEMTFGHNADVSYYLDGGALQFVANAGAQPMFRNYGWYDKYIYNAIQVPSGTTLRLINDTYNVWLYGVISGGGTLQMEAQSGGGEWHLYGTNTYTGGTVYNGTANSNQGYCRLAVYASGGLGTGLVTLNGGNISTATQTSPRAGLHFMTANTSFSNNFFLQADSPIFASAAGISLSGNVDTNGKTLYLRGTGSATISGVISGSGSVTKLDTGTWTLSGPLNYTGGTTVTGGVLVLSKGDVPFPSSGSTGQFGSAHTVTINSGGTLQLDTSWVTGDGLVNKAVVNGGTLYFGAGDNYWGNIELTGGQITTRGSGNPWRTGNWGSGLIKVNASTVSSMISGRLCFVGTGSAPVTTFDVADGAVADDLIVSASIYDHSGFEGQMALVKDGPGTMVLSGTGNTYGGQTRIQAGTLKLGASEVIPHGSGKGNVVLNAAASGVAGILDLNGFNETINGLSGTTGTVLGQVVNNKSGTTATLTVGAGDATATFAGILADNTGTGGTLALVKTGTGTQTLTGPLNYTGGTTVNGGVLVLSKGDVPFPGPGSTGQFGSAHTVTINSGGTLQVAANWVLGDGLQHTIKVNGGTLEFANSDNYQGKIELTGGRITTSGGYFPWRTGNWGDGLITVKASSTSSNIEGSLCFVGTSSATKTTFSVEDGAAADDLVVSATIYDHPGYERQMTLVKDGPGTMVLFGVNTYGGSTNIVAGTLKVGASGTIPDGAGKGNVVLNAAASGVAGILDLNGFNETINGLSGTTGTVLGRVVNNKSGTTATLTVGAGDATATFAGILADNTGTGGTLALVKTGTGTQTLTGPLNYTGGTTVNGGVLVLAQPGLGWTTNGQFGSSGHVLTVNSGATLRLTERGLLGNGQSHQLIINGGTVEFLHETYQSRIEMTGGRIVSTPSGSIVNVWRTGNAGNGQITVKASANSSTIEGRLTFVKTASATKTTFDVEDGPAAQDLIVSAQIVDHGGGYEGMELVKSGAGTMVLSGTNTYIGPTTILAGKLLLTGTHTPATTPGLYTVGAGGLLGGTGTTKAPVLVQGTIAPGASVGTIHTGSQTWAPAGTYQWEIQDVDAGPGTGWDLVDITGTLDITATPAQPFVIDVVSLGAGGLPGLVGDFNPLGVYSWEIARTTGGVSGFSPEKFLVDLDNFQNSWHGGRWWVSLQGNSVFLNYAIPEPSSGLLALVALVGLGLWRWLNRSNILAA